MGDQSGGAGPEWKLSGRGTGSLNVYGGGGNGRVRARQRSQAVAEGVALSQGLLLWLLLSMGGMRATMGPLRPLCRPINATLAAENEACPVCITFTTSICAGYCPSMVSCPERAGTSPAGLRTGAATSAPGWLTQGLAHRGGSRVEGWPAPWAGAGELKSEQSVWEYRGPLGHPNLGFVGGRGKVRGGLGPGQTLMPLPPPAPASRCGCCRPLCRLCPSLCAPTVS